MLPPSYGRPPAEKKLTVKAIRPYSVYGVFEIHIYDMA